MNNFDFPFAGTTLTALPSGGLWWQSGSLLTVSDLHLGKSERVARRGGPMLPPYETEDALARLDADIQLTRAQTVVCLGDSFDDLIAAESLTEAASLWITRLQAGRRWIWIEGNHDAGPTGLAGSHLSELAAPPLTFRHITRERTHGEISGHYHPKATVQARGRTISRACFLYDEDRLILPSYGTYTGGLLCTSQPLSSLMSPKAHAILTGTNPVCIPMPRDRGARP